MRTKTRRTTIVAMVLMVVLSTLVTLNGPALADGDDEPDTGPWAEDGSVFRDMVRLSADDPDADPVDWYRVNLTAGATQLDMLTISVNMTRNGAAQYFVWASIHDPDGALLQETKTTSYAVKSTGVLAHRTGVYLVRVYTYSYLECHYHLEFNITQEANVTDGDDVLEDATFLEPPAEVTGRLHGIRDTFDHYAVNLTRDPLHYEFVEVRLEPNGTSVGKMDLDLFLIIIDDTGVPRDVSSSTSNGSREVAFFAATVENVTIYIRCHAYGGDTGYKLNVTVYRVSDDGNNNIYRAEDIDVGTPRNDSLNLTDRLDYFKVNLTGGDLLWVFVQAHDYDPDARKPDLNIYLYNPAGRIINWSHAYDPLERVTWEVPMGDEPADYYILVTFFDRNPGDGIPAWGEYDINVTVDHAPRILADLPLVLDEDGTFGPESIYLLLEDPENNLGMVTALEGEMLNVTITSHPIEGRRLTVVPEANYTGIASFSLEVTDAYRTVILTVPVNVTPVPDAPAAVSPLPVIELDEDTSLEMDLRDYIVDGDDDPLLFEPVFSDDHPLAGSSLAGNILTITPADDFFGETNLTINATDPSGLFTVVELPVLVRPVEDAPVVLLDDANLTAVEDERGTEFDLTTLFRDPDGDPLIYTIEPDENVLFIVVGDVLRVDPAKDFSGEVVLSITAEDAEGNEATADLTLGFLPVDDPPVFTLAQPDTDVTMNEGDTVTFTITAKDPEGHTLTYAWYIDGGLLRDETLPRLEFVTHFNDQGGHLLRVVVSDGSEEAWYNWSILVENVNRPPTLTVNRPKDGETFEEGSNIVFEALATDPDEEALSVQWTEDGKVIGTGFAFTTSGLSPGKHQITVRAIDPHGAASEANLTVEVEEAGGLPGPSAGLAIVTIAVSAMAVAVRGRRRK